MNFSICFEPLFTELPFHERLKKIKSAGFDAVEFWDSRDKDLDALLIELKRLNMNVTTFSGQRQGSTFLAEDREAYLSEVRQNMILAKKMGCKSLMLLTDSLSENGHVLNPHTEIDPIAKIANTVSILNELAEHACSSEITLLLEPLNTKVDHPGYFLNDSKTGFDIIKSVDRPHIRLLYDAYHMFTMGEDILKDVANNHELIGHIHLADSPGRHEPGTGNIPFHELLTALKSCHFKGPVGFEFFPVRDNAAALASISELVN